MQAKSLVGSARVIDRRLEDLLSANVLADAPEAWTHAAVIRETLGDVAEQLRASVPLPAASDDPDSDDERLFRLLDVLAGQQAPTPERVAEAVADESSPAGDDSSASADFGPGSGTGSGLGTRSGTDSGSGTDPGPETVAADGPDDGPSIDGPNDGDESVARDRLVASLRDDGRVEVRGSTLVVPLGDDPAGRNWWAVLEYLRESVGDLAAKAGRVRSRMIVTGADGLLVEAWDSVAERLDALGEVLQSMTDNGRYAGRQAAAGDGPTEFAAWTAEQFGRDA